MPNGSLSPDTTLSVKRDRRKYVLGGYVPGSSKAVWSALLKREMRTCNRRAAFQTQYSVLTAKLDDVVAPPGRILVVLIDSQPVDILINSGTITVDAHETWCDMFWHRRRYTVTLQFAGVSTVCEGSGTISCALPLLSVTVKRAVPLCATCCSTDTRTLAAVAAAYQSNNNSEAWAAKLGTNVVSVVRFTRLTGWHCKTCALDFDTLAMLAAHMGCTEPFYKASAAGTLVQAIPKPAYKHTDTVYTFPVNARHLEARLSRLL